MNAGVAFPFVIAALHRDSLVSSFASVPLFTPAGTFAARAHGIGEECGAGRHYSRIEPDQLILTVDFSRAALTAHLLYEDCAIFEQVRVLHDTQLGTNGLSETSSGQRQLVKALREITRRPVKDGNFPDIEHVNNVVLFGESASDKRLHDALDQVRHGQFGRSSLPMSNGRTRGVKPLFAASKGVAEALWNRLSGVHGFTCDQPPREPVHDEWKGHGR
ncbi:MAG: hypothetical protein Q9179_002113 [Wetmoreana sp. 5 TL-2023]